ncbi:putative Germination protein, Ger(X)C family [uncultured Eubacteriales bacterium]|uniref:Putative Germination protein, Ger(X)C family n=1 Tax=uncultured Eubacteriales bacterium TaxID=172733 RepID=A0A212KBX2_9FIRM|nr:putative Germination protein, Ger(X)C family [uncultured Eubacteriales bacterium]
MTKRAMKIAGRAFWPLSSPTSYQCPKNVRRAAGLLSCVLLVLCLNACWSQRELNKLAIVVGTGLDVGDEPDTLKITAQVVKASEIGSGSPGKGKTSEGKAYVNISYTDKSVLSAVREITHMQNRRLYFSHSDVLIFSSDLAKLDMAEGLDAFTRDYEARMNIYILISKGSASEILKEDVDLEKAPALHISGMMENQESNSETVVVTLRDFMIATLSESTAPVAPMIDLYESDGKKYARLEGTAVFKQGKLIGELDKAQTRGLLWVMDKAKSGATTVDTQWGQVVLEMLHSSSSLKPVKTKEGGIRMQLTINVDGTIESNETTEDMSRLENVELLKEKMKEDIRSDIESSLSQAREFSADIFGFGEAIRREYPEEWKEMKGNWEDVFPKIELDVQVNVELRSTGGLTKPGVPGGAK